MKKDFSQPFTDAHATIVHILAEDTSSGQFLTVRFSDEDKGNDGVYSEEFWSLPQLELKTEDDLAQHLTKVLSSYGFVVNQFREISRVNHSLYSFVDDAPGEIRKHICMHAGVEHVNFFPEGLKVNESVHIMSLTDLSLKTHIEHSSDAVRFGLALLRSEREMLR